MKHKQILRRCVTCRKLIDRKELWRVVRDYQDGVVLDKGMGRSAYLCPQENCLKEAWHRKRLQKALRCQVDVSVIEVLQDRLNHCNDSITKAR
ncbi:YlxR family protein [Prochlorococcus marinus]|uniref:YlxR family protein n=1 Tax=Prochlorococcus marinus TaxID=1219 RepID=UPI0022B5B7A2|nr:YlxR family protein [Prochlorococcus marinus]